MKTALVFLLVALTVSTVLASDDNISQLRDQLLERVRRRVVPGINLPSRTAENINSMLGHHGKIAGKLKELAGASAKQKRSHPSTFFRAQIEAMKKMRDGN